MTPSTEPWWKQTVVYQIYPRSFADADGDGIGDLAGVIDRLDYLADLGVETLWLSPFYPSPQADFGYDISDYRGIAPEYGDMATFERLVDETHRRGLRLVLDLVLNHTSDQHPWFVESRSSRDNPKRDWYVWRDGVGGGAPPNNWFNMIGGRGWHHDPHTDQWYWAQFLPFQPDLNDRNPEVRAEMFDVLRFWMAKGVDGFRLDIVNALFEDPEIRDNPFAWKLLPSAEDPGMLFRSTENTLNHPDTMAFMRELRRAVDDFDGRDRFLVGEVIAPLEKARESCGAAGDGLHLVFLFESLTASLDAASVRALLERYEQLFADPLLPTWVFGNHDRRRRISRLGGSLEKAKLNAALQLTARGVPFLYNGEEVGIEQHHLPVRDSLDAVVHRFRSWPQPLFDLVCTLAGESLNRDECRTPMQWSDAANAGFCPPGATPWLPLAPSFRERNVATQQGDPESLWHCYRRLLAARRECAALRSGSQRLLPAVDLPASVVGFSRFAPEGTSPREARVLLNCGADAVDVRVTDGAAPWVSTRARVPEVREGRVRLRPWEGLILTRD
jgi:oligo-1,6-glucosidase/alpha-glucosidase